MSSYRWHCLCNNAGTDNDRRTEEHLVPVRSSRARGSATLHFFNLHLSQALPTLAIPRRRAWKLSGLASKDTDGLSSRSRFRSGSKVLLVALCFFLFARTGSVASLGVRIAMVGLSDGRSEQCSQRSDLWWWNPSVLGCAGQKCPGTCCYPRPPLSFCWRQVDDPEKA